MKTLAILFILYFSGLSFMPCDAEAFHSEITTECTEHHEDESQKQDNHHHKDGESHCACHCHHIQAYFQIGDLEVVSIKEPASHISFYQNRSDDSHLQGMFKPPKV